MRRKIGCIVLFFVLFICGCGGSTAYTVPYESNSNQMEGRFFDDENDNESEIKSGKEKKDSSKKNKPLVTRKTIIKEDSGIGYEYSYYNYDYDSKNRITSEKYYVSDMLVSEILYSYDDDKLVQQQIINYLEDGTIDIDSKYDISYTYEGKHILRTVDVYSGLAFAFESYDELSTFRDDPADDYIVRYAAENKELSGHKDFFYDNEGRLLAWDLYVENKHQVSTWFAYDSKGNLSLVTYSEGGVYTNQNAVIVSGDFYDSHGNPTIEFSPGIFGMHCEYFENEYDSDDNLICSIGYTNSNSAFGIRYDYVTSDGSLIDTSYVDLESNVDELSKQNDEFMERATPQDKYEMFDKWIGDFDNDGTKDALFLYKSLSSDASFDVVYYNDIYGSTLIDSGFFDRAYDSLPTISCIFCGDRLIFSVPKYTYGYMRQTFFMFDKGEVITFEGDSLEQCANGRLYVNESCVLSVVVDGQECRVFNETGRYVPVELIGNRIERYAVSETNERTFEKKYSNIDNVIDLAKENISKFNFLSLGQVGMDFVLSDIEEAGYYTTNGDIVYLTFTAKLSAEGMYALYDANGKSVFFENINDATIYATAECIEMDDKLLLSNVFLGDVKDPE